MCTNDTLIRLSLPFSIFIVNNVFCVIINKLFFGALTALAIFYWHHDKSQMIHWFKKKRRTFPNWFIGHTEFENRFRCGQQMCQFTNGYSNSENFPTKKKVKSKKGAFTIFLQTYKHTKEITLQTSPLTTIAVVKCKLIILLKCTNSLSINTHIHIEAYVLNMRIYYNTQRTCIRTYLKDTNKSSSSFNSTHILV